MPKCNWRSKREERELSPEILYEILYKNADPKETMTQLFKRKLKEEF